MKEDCDTIFINFHVFYILVLILLIYFIFYFLHEKEQV